MRKYVRKIVLKVSHISYYCIKKIQSSALVPSDIYIRVRDILSRAAFFWSLTKWSDRIALSFLYKNEERCVRRYFKQDPITARKCQSAFNCTAWRHKPYIIVRHEHRYKSRVQTRYRCIKSASLFAYKVLSFQPSRFILSNRAFPTHLLAIFLFFFLSRQKFKIYASISFQIRRV